MGWFEQNIATCLVGPESKVRLREHDPAFSGDPSIPEQSRKEAAAQFLKDCVASLGERQEQLYAADSWSLLVILQGMDTSGKDGIIRHVMTGLNPQGCKVVSFSHPSPKELEHNFLWRYARELPERGHVTVFNRSYYEEVLIVRIHPSVLAAQRNPYVQNGQTIWQARFEDINAFEQHLTRNGTVILKFFLHLSKEEQRQRLLARVKNPAKHWKFSLSDISERRHWKDYERAYEEALSHTSTAHAPWYVIPADRKWMSRALIAGTILQKMRSLGLKDPTISPELKKQIALAKQELERETPND
jgi:PPK2 family polyphosphate:nucleotide phosphotransferase